MTSPSLPLESRKYHIRRVSPGALSFHLAALFGVVSLVSQGVILIATLMTKDAKMAQQLGQISSGFVFGFLMTTLMGAILGLVLAWVYNGLSRFTQGLLVEITEAPRQED